MKLSDCSIIILAKDLNIHATLNDVLNKLVEEEIYSIEFVDEFRRCTNKTETFKTILIENKSDPYKILKVFLSFGYSGKVVETLRKDGFDIEKLLYRTELLQKQEKEIITVSELKLHIVYKLRTRSFDEVLKIYKQIFSHMAKRNWESANSMIRTFLEGLLIQIATKKGGNKEKIKKYSEAIVYLRDNEFFKRDEASFVSTIFGFFSVKGAHFGISNEFDSRVRLMLAISLGSMFLEKFIKSSAR